MSEIRPDDVLPGDGRSISSSTKPLADVVPEPRPRRAKLFSPKQIFAATLLATPVAGGLLAAINLRRLERGMAWMPLAIGVLVIAGGVAADRWWWWAVWALLPTSSLVAAAWASAAFDDDERDRKESSWLVVILCAALLLTFEGMSWAAGAAGLRVIGPVELLSDLVPTQAGGAVRYSRGATREQAERVGKVLEQGGLRGVKVDISHPRDDLIVHMRVSEIEPRVVEIMRVLVARIADELDACVVGELEGFDGKNARGRSCPSDPER